MSAVMFSPSNPSGSVLSVANASSAPVSGSRSNAVTVESSSLIR